MKVTVEKVKAVAYFREFGGNEGRVRVERRLVQKDERGEIVAEDKGGLEGAGGKWRSPQAGKLILERRGSTLQKD